MESLSTTVLGSEFHTEGAEQRKALSWMIETATWWRIVDCGHDPDKQDKRGSKHSLPTCGERIGLDDFVSGNDFIFLNVYSSENLTSLLSVYRVPMCSLVACNAG